MDARIDRTKLLTIIGKKQWSNKELYDRWKMKYKVNMKYSNFMELMSNNISWKLSYAFSLCEMLDVDIYELFEFVPEYNVTVMQLNNRQ